MGRDPLTSLVAQSPPTTARTLAVQAVALLVGLYAIANSFSIGVSIVSRIAYAIIVVVLVAAVLIRRPPSEGRDKPAAGSLLAWSGFALFELVQLPWTPSSDVGSAFSDCAIVLTPWLCYLVIRGRSDRMALRSGYIIITYLSFIATLTGWALSGGARFQAPEIVAITGAWVLAAAPQRLLQTKHHSILRGTGWLMVVILLPALLASRSRTSLIAWIASGALVLIVPALKRPSRMVVVALVSTIALAALLQIQSTLTTSPTVYRLLEQTRLADFASGQVDISGETRLLEIADVRSTMAREGGALNHLLGFGHGASYVPEQSDIVANINPLTGRVHNIHVTPFLIWFRYGYVGLALFLAMLAQALLTSVRDLRANTDLPALVNVLSLLMFMVELSFFNSTADPEFSFVLGAIFAVSRARSSPASRDRT